MNEFETLFDDNYKIYDKVRPEYPQQLFVGVTMSKSTILKLFLLIGLCPFVAPYIYNMVMQWELLDMMVLWSYVYWPTYIIGLFLIGISIYKLKK